MVKFIGCAPGGRHSGSAGANRGTVVVDLTAVPEDAVGLRFAASGLTAVLTPGPESPNLAVVLFHRESAGTFHGLGRPESAEAFAARHAAWVAGGRVNRYGMAECGEPQLAACELPLGSDELRWSARSSSNGADIAGAVIVLRPGAEPVNILTSGYDGRRGWTVRTVHSGGRVESRPLAEWRALRVEAETLG